MTCHDAVVSDPYCIWRAFGDALARRRKDGAAQDGFHEELEGSTRALHRNARVTEGVSRGCLHRVSRALACCAGPYRELHRAAGAVVIGRVSWIVAVARAVRL